MPGEERKFKRRRMTAFVPAFRREREVAASQAEETGADGEVKTGVAVGEGEGVRGEATILVMVNVGVGEASGVPVGSGSFVDVDSVILVTVAEGRGVREAFTILVTLSGWVGAGVEADEIEVGDAGTAGEFFPPGAGVVEALGLTVDRSAGA